MFKLLTGLSIFAYANAQGISCLDGSTACEDGTECFYQDATVNTWNFKTFKPIVITKTKATCEDEALPTIMGTDSTCQTAKAAMVVSLPMASGQCEDLENVVQRTSVPGFLDLDIGFGAATLDHTGCDESEHFSLAVSNLAECVLTQDMMDYVYCEKTFPADCPDWATAIVTEYPDCACNALFNAVGVAGYEYIPIINNWVQGYMGAVGDFFEGCDTSLLDIDCWGHVPNCEVNSDPYLEMCNEIALIPSGVGRIEAEVQVCTIATPPETQTGKRKPNNDYGIRNKIWNRLKRATTTQFVKYGVTIEAQAFVRETEISNKNKGKRSKDKFEDFDLDVTCDFDAGEYLMGLFLEFIYDDFSDLIEVFKAYREDDSFATNVFTEITALASTIAEEDALENGKIEVTQLEAKLTLYDSEGEVWAEVGSEAAAAEHSVRVIIAGLAVVMIAWM